MLFDKATLAINKGMKVGLVGRNGTGKSTLFRLVKQDIDGDHGAVNIRKGTRIGTVDQEVPSGPQTLLDTVLAADKERASLLAEADTATDPNRIATIHTRLADIDAYSAEARAATILAGLGFTHDDQHRPCSDFSGGWRMRVALAGVLFSNPDLLLLDEPTNYLDVEGAVWLEAHLRKYRGTAFIISHDRDFLNQAVTHIAHLKNGKFNLFTGGYDVFETRLAEQQRLNMALVGKQEDERRRLEAFVSRFKAKASKAKQAQSRVKRLEKMAPIATIINDPIDPFDLPSAERRLSPPILRWDDTALGYDETRVLSRLNLRIDPDDRIGLLGKNGQGKSTFAKSILGILSAQEGYIRRHKKLKIGYFAQHEVDALNINHSAYDHVVELMPDATEAERRGRLARFGLGHEKAETKAGDLSGGEKARLLFSLISFHAPHMLVLDEPTNHLDIDSRAELMKALNDFDGAVLLISHDRNLLESVVDRLWCADKGTIARFDGSLEDYKQLQLEGERADKKVKTNTKPSQADIRRAAAESRAKLAPMRKELKKIEARIDKTRVRLVQIDTALSAPDLFTRDKEQAITLGQERARLEESVETDELRWLELSQTLETLQF
ncbi:MAG: ABC-F family ATP-binding cassette domain-containing protein [Maricaulaceae bacterium]